MHRHVCVAAWLVQVEVAQFSAAADVADLDFVAVPLKPGLTYMATADRLEPNHDYTVRVAAETDAGCSKWSISFFVDDY